ncbi:MAG: hypothetical protein Q4B77_03285 [Coriobacteriaceae bacterium]|nr:hypothetical protein [Coriobacteriaceae bacterium]
MARTATAPQPALTSNNRIYLYRLLATELGCGKQTFLPAVEEALAADRMTADDLGFENTRALLEALEEFIKLTVFKGGRIYATVIAQPEWDTALAALEAGSKKDPAKNGKPWKRKKADKALKPVRPKRVKRPEPEVEEAAGAPKAEAVPQSDDVLTGRTLKQADAASPEAEPAKESQETPSAPADEGGSNQESQGPAAGISPTEGSHADESQRSKLDVAAADLALNLSGQTTPAGIEPEASALPKPAISLTVVYDPYNGVDRETTIQSHPVIAKPAAPKAPAANSATESAASTAAKPAVPKASVANSTTERVASTVSAKPTSRTSAPSANGFAKDRVEVKPAQNTPMASVNSTTANQPAPASLPSCAHTPEAQPAAPASQTVEDTVAQQVGLPTSADAPAQPIAPRTVAPEVLATYPADFAEEVYPSSEVIAKLCELLPYGTDVFGLLAEDYQRALKLELVNGTRARLTFPLRIQHIDSVEPIAITLKKRAGAGLAWELSAVQ